MTPHPIAYRMAELAGVARKSVLDPTCGEGRLLRYALELGAAKALGVEIDASLAAFAARSGAEVLRGDFIELAPVSLRAEVLLLNPPFTTGGPDTAAILNKAIEGHWTGTSRAALILQNGPAGQKLIEPYRGLIVYEEKLPDDTFKKEGTNVSSTLYVLERLGSA